MDYLELITNKQSELSPMFDRMDGDAAMFHSKPYQMLGVDGKKIDKAYHVTLLDAAQFLDKAVSRITSVSRQVLVESCKLPGEKTSAIENFLNDLQFEIDARLGAKGEADAFTQHAELVCARGPIVEQNLLRVENGRLIPDSRPIDSRWFTYELTEGKMMWGCVETLRTAADVESEFGYRITGTTGAVLDFWDENSEAIFVDGHQVDERPNGYGYPPFVIAFPSTSSALKDPDYYLRLGDSIMHSLRTGDGHYLFDEKNFIASNLKTLSSKSIAPDLQFPSPADGDYQALPAEYPAGTGVMLQTKEPAELIPRPDVANSTLRYAEMIQEQIDRGSFSAMDYGTISLPLSAVAIARLTSGREELMLPRLNALAALCQSSGKMKIRQFQRFGEKLELGEEGHRRTHSPVDLNGEYVIKYRYYTSSQEQMAGAAAICNALGDHVSEEYKQDQVLILRDPAGERAQIAIEQAAKADPIIALENQMREFIKAQEASDDKETKDWNDLLARTILERIISIMKQRKTSESQPMAVNLEQNTVAKPAAIQAVPVFGGGRQVKTQ